MCDAHGKPREQCREAGKADEPVEDLRANVRKDVDVGEGREDHDNQDTEEGAGGLVDVAEDLGKEALVGEGQQGSGAAVDAGETHGKDGDENSGIDEVVKTLDVGPAHEDDHRRAISPIALEKEGLVVRDSETDHENDDQEEDDYTPDDAFDGARHGVHRVGSLRRGKGHELRARVTECRRDEDSADALEAVCERAWIVPVASADVASILTRGGSSSTDADDGDENENENNEDLQGGLRGSVWNMYIETHGPELFLRIAQSAK